MTIPIQSNDPVLSGIQANILKGHGRNFAHHIFLRFIPGHHHHARTWIAAFAASTVTSARHQLDGIARYHGGLTKDAGSIVTFSLSASGFDKLGLVKPNSESFKTGMKARAAFLGDDPNTMEEPFDGIDAMIMIADDHSSIARHKAHAIIAQTQTFAHLLVDQKGNVLKTKSGIGIEHFGYADGISQPLFLANDIDRQPSAVEWNDATDPGLLLVKEPSHDAADHFGSFLVFRKLEQNVKAFKNAEGDNKGIPGQLPIVKDVDGDNNDELAGAMLVGRFENGTPVVKNSEARVDNPPVQTNDFDYRDDLNALKCPFHAHIRLMTPRNGDTAAGDVRAQRITRRGIPYDEAGRIPESQINTISDELLDANQPEKGVGLLFMCYQSSIENQFEILQGLWANQGQIKGHAIGAQDSIIGQGTNPPKTLPHQWGQPAQSAPFSFSGFVTMKGGEYLYTPSIGLLKSLASPLNHPAGPGIA